MSKSEIRLDELIKDCEKIWNSSTDRRFIKVVSNGSSDLGILQKELDKKGIIYLVDSQEKSVRESYTIDLNKIKIIY